jgi:hypothetical protein
MEGKLVLQVCSQLHITHLCSLLFTITTSLIQFLHLFIDLFIHSSPHVYITSCTLYYDMVMSSKCHRQSIRIHLVAQHHQLTTCYPEVHPLSYVIMYSAMKYHYLLVVVVVVVVVKVCRVNHVVNSFMRYSGTHYSS